MAISPLGNSNQYLNINSATTTVVKGTCGILHSITVNTLGTTPTFQLWDNTAASGTKIGLITPTAAGTYIFDSTFSTGLTIVSTGSGFDITVNYL